jgi:hypothetical protein
LPSAWSFRASSLLPRSTRWPPNWTTTSGIKLADHLCRGPLAQWTR